MSIEDIEYDLNSLPVAVKYEYEPATLPDLEYPGDAAHIEILEIKVNSVNIIEYINDFTIDNINEYIRANS